MRLGQFFNTASPSSANILTLSDFIRVADEIQGGQHGFTLQSAIVNDYILTHTVKNGQDELTTYLQDNDLGSEIIDFVVLQAPAVNISTGGLQTFSLISEVYYNAALLPSASDLLLYRTFESISKRKQIKEIDYPYSPLNPEFLDSRSPPIDYEDLIQFEHDATESGSIVPISEVEPMVRMNNIEPILEARSFDDSLGDSPGDGRVLLISRKEAALHRFLYQNLDKIKELGFTVPLTLIPWALLARGALSLATTALTNEKVQKLVKDKLNNVKKKLKKMYKDNKGDLLKTAQQTAQIVKKNIQSGKKELVDKIKHPFKTLRQIANLILKGEQVPGEKAAFFLQELSKIKEPVARRLQQAKEELERQLQP